MSGAVDFATYKETLIVLGTAGLIIPAMQRLRISPIVGYLAAGAILGPFGLGTLVANHPWLQMVTISDNAGLSAIAELGIVFLMFIIGLELSFQRLFTLRKLVFGLGSLQLVSATSVIAGIVYLMGFDAGAAVLVGSSLALSSTAIVVEVLARKNRLSSSAGRASFSILLFQDLSVIPILVGVTLLAPQSGGTVSSDVLLAIASGVAMIAAITLIGRRVLRPVLRYVASLDSPELFLAAVLLIIIGSGILAAWSGLSMALGSFVAGLLLADTEYKAAIESLISPFKGLLLGVFFITIGTQINALELIINPIFVITTVLGLIVVKTITLVPLVRLFGLSWSAAIETGLLIGSAGEFAFIVLALATSEGLITPQNSADLLTIVAVSMALIPLSGRLGRLISKRSLSKLDTLPVTPEDHASEMPSAIIVGGGRVGRLVADMLAQHGMSHLITDRDPSIVSGLRKNGRNVYYGDARQVPFLKTCGIDRAPAVIVTVNSPADTDAVIEAVRGVRPDIPIIARARDAAHAKRLYRLGATDAVPETIEASLQLSEASLVALGVPVGLVIGSIHEQRDQLRRDLQEVVGDGARPVRGVRPRREAD
jgi:CPA2 family monovalent cation:H+ antiporter-2